MLGAERLQVDHLQAKYFWATFTQVVASVVAKETATPFRVATRDRL